MPATVNATTAMPATRHTRSSANRSSENNMWDQCREGRGREATINIGAVQAEVPERIPLEEVYMRMAEELAKRSTCARSQVGSVVTTGDLTQVLGIGYNGNARGLPNSCDSPEPGRCGCLHSEANALI